MVSVMTTSDSPVPAGEAVTAVRTDADGTRAALIRAGIDLFGRNGFDGVSTREIARVAGVNIAGIAYHFGGKAGLHRACGEAIAAIAAERIALPDLPPGGVDALDPTAAADLFVSIVCGIGRFMLGRPEAETIARFMVREQMDPSATFAVLYERLIRPRHEAMCRIFARATGEEATSETVIIAVSAMFGPIMFFRVGRATALTRLGWDEIDATRLETVLGVVTETVRAAIAARRAAVIATGKATS
jgi:AcrR family transcriptional regulator